MHRIKHHLIFQMALVAVLIIYFMVMTGVAFNHDTAWYFVATQKWLNGDKLYVDIIEVNPPWSFYCTVPGVLLARVLGTSVANGFALSIVLLTWISFTVVQKIMFGIERQNTIHNMLVVFGVLAIVISLTMSQFGQREHIFILCVLPYLFMVYAEQRQCVYSRTGRVFLAILASIGILLKPYFVLLPLIIGLSSALSSRDIKMLFKIEYMVMVSACVLYVAFIYIAHNEYFTFLLPYAVDTYGDYGFSDTRVRGLLPLKLILFMVVTTFILVEFSSTLKAAGYFGVAAIGGVLIYYMQSKGFTYQAFPFYVFGWIFLLIIFIDGFKSDRIWHLFVGILGIYLFIEYTPKPNIYRESYDSGRLSKELEQFDDDKMAILTLTSTVSATFPYMSAPNRVWASRFPTQWFLPGALNSLHMLDCTDKDNFDECKRYNEILDYVRNSNVEDIEKYSPDVIAVDVKNKKSYIKGEFSFLEFMQKHAEFDALWDGYELYSEDNRWEIWMKI